MSLQNNNKYKYKYDRKNKRWSQGHVSKCILSPGYKIDPTSIQGVNESKYGHYAPGTQQQMSMINNNKT